MDEQQERLRDAFLAECWPTCREVPRELRESERRKAAELSPGAVETAVDRPREVAS